MLSLAFEVPSLSTSLAAIVANRWSRRLGRPCRGRCSLPLLLVGSAASLDKTSCNAGPPTLDTCDDAHDSHSNAECQQNDESHPTRSESNKRISDAGRTNRTIKANPAV